MARLALWLQLCVTTLCDRLIMSNRQLPLLFRATVPCRLFYALTPSSLLSMNWVGGLTPCRPGFDVLCDRVRLRYVLRNALSRSMVNRFVPMFLFVRDPGWSSMHMALRLLITCSGLTRCGLCGEKLTAECIPGLVRTVNVPCMLNYLSDCRCALTALRLWTALV